MQTRHMTVLQSLHSGKEPSFFAALELIKPITWFPPMWAYACGAVSAGVGFDSRLWLVALGIFHFAKQALGDDSAPTRFLLVKRLGRSLPGSKGGGSSKKYSTPVNCQGSWGSWRTCGSDSKQKRTYSITRAAQHGGSACPYSHGATEQQSCVQNIDCIGSFGPYGSCLISERKNF